MRTRITLIPIQISNKIFKVVQTIPALMDPQFAPCYTLIYHGTFSHAYSLLADPAPVTREQAQVVYPLAVYTTNTKKRCATIADLPSADRNNNSSYQRNPSKIRLGFHKDFPLNGHLEFQTLDGTQYIWQKIEVAATNERLYYLHMRPQIENLVTTLAPTAIPGLVDNSALNCQPLVPVARVVKIPFENPIDGTALWGLELDTSRVDPVIAFMTCFAGMTSHVAPSLTSTVLTSKNFDPSAKLLENVKFVDKSGETWFTVGSRVCSLMSTDSDKENGDENAGPSTAGQDGHGAAAKPFEVKVFLRSYVSKLALPRRFLDLLNQQGGLIMQSQRNLCNLG